MNQMISDTIYSHFKDVYEARVSPMIGKPTLIEPEETISSVINKITKSGSYDVFYYNGKSVLSTNIRSLLVSKNTSQTKVEPFLYPIPHLKPTDRVQKAANIIAHYRVREVPVVEKGKIIGVISAKSLLKKISSMDNKWIKANLIYTQNPITASFDDSLSTARQIMFSKKIDHIPIIKNGKVNQVLTAFHLLASLSPKEKLGRRSVGTNKIRNLESNIGNIGSTRIPQCSVNDDLSTITSSMLKTDSSCCLVNLWNNLQGIITYRDILSLLAIKIESEIPFFMVGLPEEQRNADLIASKFKATLKRIAKVYSEIQEAKVSIKQQRLGGKKEGKFEASIMITTPHHAPLIYSSVGFDLSQVIEELNQKLLRTLSKRAKRRSKFSVRKVGLPINPV